jgi:hypothetical protein
MSYDSGSPEHIAELRKSSWSLQRFTTRHGLVDRNTGVLHRYDGQPYDPERFELCEDAWEHDHCVTCGRVMMEHPDDAAIDTGYTDGKEWLCASCFTWYLGKSNEST